MAKIYDTIIIGAGIAGLTSAIYASRKRMSYEIISSDFGGQFSVSGEVLNYPGILKTTGYDFMNNMREQIKFNNIDLKLDTVRSISKSGKNFKIRTDKNEYLTKTIIVATGARARMLGIVGEEKFQKKGVTYCSICDGPLFYGMPVVIVGSGNSALEAVDFLKDIASKIYLLVNKDKFDAHEYLIESISKIKKLKILYNSNVSEIYGKDFVEGIKYIQNKKENSLNVKGVIVEIGRIPNTELFENLLELDEHKHIMIDCQTRTSVPGIFGAGDCASGHEYQYVIAAGQGCMALIKAARYIAELKPTKD